MKGKTSAETQCQCPCRIRFRSKYPCEVAEDGEQREAGDHVKRYARLTRGATQKVKSTRAHFGRHQSEPHSPMHQTNRISFVEARARDPVGCATTKAFGADPTRH